MGWRVGKQTHRARTTKSKPKISGWEEMGLIAPSRERREVSMEEIRRQGRLLAGVGIGQTHRLPKDTTLRPVASRPRPAKATTRSRRGSSR